jgi:hypothetical protein
MLEYEKLKFKFENNNLNSISRETFHNEYSIANLSFGGILLGLIKIKEYK